MSREDITRMAREAGFVGMDGDHGALRRFAALVAAAEREACAHRVEAMGAQGFGTLAIAAAIRLNNKQHEQEKE